MQARRRRQEAPRRWRGLSRWLGGLLTVLSLLAVLVWGGSWLSRPGTLPVKAVRVQGELVHMDSGELQAVIRPYVQDGFLRVDMVALRTALETLPWVRRCSVRRAWPDTLDLRITEQRALARWLPGGLLNLEGERFIPAEAEWPAGLPAFSGPQGSERLVTARYHEMQRILTPAGLAIASLSMDTRRAWRLRLSNGIEVMLGRSEYESRLQRLLRVYPELVAPQAENIARVDLRYTNGFAVAWRGGRAANG